MSLRRYLAAALALLLLWGLSPARAASDPAAEYMVRYRESAARLMESEGSVPFDVVSKSELDRLLAQDLIEWYEEDGDAFLLDAEPEASLTGALSPYYDDAQWNLDMIGADEAFQRNLLGQGIRIGVIDSGVSPHPDFGSRLLSGYNYTPDAKSYELHNTEDLLGHGTRVAGLIAAAGDSGYIGAAPGAEIVPLKCTNSNTVKISAICQAIYDAIDMFGCTVLNLSLGVATEYDALRDAISYADKRGVVVVAAAGNGRKETLMYPACYDTVIGVGAVNGEGVVYANSNHNESVFLTAPGVSVRTTSCQGGYTTGTGTSFSVPQVAAAAAVLLGIDGTLTSQEIMDLLAQTASDRGTPGYDEYYGYGILNVGGSAAILAGEPDPSEPCQFLPAEGTAVALRNNTGAELDCIYLLAEYSDDGACRSVKTVPITVPPWLTVAIDAPSGDVPFVQIVCRAEDFTPLIPARTS